MIGMPPDHGLRSINLVGSNAFTKKPWLFRRTWRNDKQRDRTAILYWFELVGMAMLSLRSYDVDLCFYSCVRSINFPSSPIPFNLSRQVSFDSYLLLRHLEPAIFFRLISTADLSSAAILSVLTRSHVGLLCFIDHSCFFVRIWISFKRLSLGLDFLGPTSQANGDSKERMVWRGCYLG